MTLVELLSKAANALDANQVEFMLIGGMAVSAWIEPRLTKDCDLVIRIRKRDQARLKAALIAAGARITQLEMRLLFEKGWRRIPIEDRKLDVRVTSSAHDRAAFDNAVFDSYEGRSIRIAMPEDLVLYKLQAWRHLIDKSDVQLLLARDDIRKDYVVSWLDRIAADSGEPMRERWEEALALGPPSPLTG